MSSADQPRTVTGKFDSQTHDETVLHDDLVDDSSEEDDGSYACAGCGATVSDDEGDSFDGRCPSCADKADLAYRIENEEEIYLEEAQHVAGESWGDDPALASFADGGDPSDEVLAAVKARRTTQRAALAASKAADDWPAVTVLREDLTRLRAVASFLEEELA